MLDKEKSHAVLAKRLNLESKAYDAKKCCTLPDRDNCLDMVNQECNLLKSLLRSHSGFRAADIQRMARPLVGLPQHRRQHGREGGMGAGPRHALPKSAQIQGLLCEKDQLAGYAGSTAMQIGLVT